MSNPSQFRPLLLVLAFLFTKGAKAQYQIMGQWYNDDQSYKIEVYEKADKFFGKIVWLASNTNSDGTSPRIDEHNPVEELRSQPLKDLVILSQLEWDENEERWENGTLYDPKTGKTYSCYGYIEEDGSLYLKGYILGLPFLGKGTHWIRK